MLKKIKAFFKKRKKMRLYKGCFKFADRNNLRTYIKPGICAGGKVWAEEYNYICQDCPYFVDIRDNDDWS